jgi:hypothetical protein
MKFNKKNIYNFFIIILILFFSYSICSTHERPNSGYISRRKSFCSTPFYIIFLVAFILIFIFNLE